ncbi:MAG: phage portal protein [Planctomycetes bacterium]|nr:phage portal protein [Planctomycetota bacterium]
MNALDQAFRDVDNMRTKAAGSIGGSAARLVASAPGQGMNTSSMGTASEQLQHNVGWPYVAARAIAHRIARQPIRVARASTRGVRSKGLTDDLVPMKSHPLLDAMREPNGVQTGWQLIVSSVFGLELTGCSYWWMPDGSNGRPEVWPLPADWVQAADLARSSWKVRTQFGQTFDVPADEMALFSLPDPSNPFGSLSPVSTQAPAIAADEAIQVTQYRTFVNGQFPGLLIKAGRLPGMVAGQPGERPTLEGHQRKELVDAIRQACQGAVNYNEPLILDGMIEGVEHLTNKPREMDFMESGKATKSRILQAYGVNPIVVGETEGANRAQAVVAEELFLTGAVNPIIRMMSESLDRWVAPRFGEGITAWIEPATARDAELTLKQWEVGLRSGAVDQNEYRSHILSLPERAEKNEPPKLFAPAPSRNGTVAVR